MKDPRLVHLKWLRHARRDTQTGQVSNETLHNEIETSSKKSLHSDLQKIILLWSWFWIPNADCIQKRLFAYTPSLGDMYLCVCGMRETDGPWDYLVYLFHY